MVYTVFFPSTVSLSCVDSHIKVASKVANIPISGEGRWSAEWG